MQNTRRILLAFEQETSGESAWQETCTLAELFGAEIILVHAISCAEFSPNYDSQAQETLKTFQRLQALGEKQGVQVSKEFIIKPGDPVEVILSAAERLDVDLIVLCARLLSGDTVERVVGMALRPVWLVRPEKAHGQLNTVLCAVDTNRPVDEEIRAALHLTRQAKAQLTFLSVIDPSESDQTAEELLAGQEQRLREALKAYDLTGIRHEYRICLGKASVKILEAIRDCDLLVVGSAGRRGLDRLLRGNTAEKFLRVAPCSLLVVKSGSETSQQLNSTDLVGLA